MMQGLNAIFGSRQKRRVDDVRYMPLDRPRPLRRKREPATQRFEVRFPSGRVMRITQTLRRRFDDLDGVTLGSRIASFERWVRPGDRVLVLGGSTGGVAAAAGALAGPTGSVVSLESDLPAVRYARVRYTSPNIAHESGGPESLGGELDGAFDCAILASAETPRIGIAETLRVVSPDRWIVARGPSLAALRAMLDMPSGAGTVEDVWAATRRP